MIQPARLLCLILLAAGASRAGDADDDARVPAAPANSGTFTLTQSQQQAVGIRIDHPMQMASPQQIDAYGLVLDPAWIVRPVTMDDLVLAYMSRARDAGASRRPGLEVVR